MEHCKETIPLAFPRNLFQGEGKGAHMMLHYSTTSIMLVPYDNVNRLGIKDDADWLLRLYVLHFLA